MQKLYADVATTFLFHNSEKKPQHVFFKKKAKITTGITLKSSFSATKIRTQKQMHHSDRPKSKFQQWHVKLPLKDSYFVLLQPHFSVKRHVST